MLHFIYRITPARAAMLATGPTEAEAAAIAAQFGYIEGLTRAGVVLVAGRTLVPDERAFGIVVFAAETPAEAEAIFRGDPAVDRGVMLGELFPYRVALLAESWKGLDAPRVA